MREWCFYYFLSQSLRSLGCASIQHLFYRAKDDNVKRGAVVLGYFIIQLVVRNKLAQASEIIASFNSKRNATRSDSVKNFFLR